MSCVLTLLTLLSSRPIDVQLETNLDSTVASQEVECYDQPETVDKLSLHGVGHCHTEKCGYVVALNCNLTGDFIPISDGG